MLLARAEYIDEEKWCEGLAEALDLKHVALYNSGNEFVPIRVRLDGVDDPLTDSRVIEAAVNAMGFLKLDAIGIEAGNCIAVLRPRHPPVARVGGASGGTMIKSQVVFSAQRLAAVERQGGALGELVGLASTAAA